MTCCNCCPCEDATPAPPVSAGFQYACSLKVEGYNQVIPRKTWTQVHFPGQAVEMSDAHGMHDPNSTGAQSGLITVKGPGGWGIIAAMAQWVDPKDATETRVQIIRDPFNNPDTTATNHKARTPGGDYYTLLWPLHLPAERPHAIRVYHNASTSLVLNLAEFKVIY